MGVLLAAALVDGPLWAQRQSPLVYDDPVFAWHDSRDPEAPRPSPNAIVGLQLGSTRVMIAYGRPGVKERTIFGGLVPYGRLWRTGANEATTITFTGGVLVEGQEMPAGTYSLFTIPGEAEWTVIFNRKANAWGTDGYENDEEVLRFQVAPREAPLQEWMQFSFQDLDIFAASVVLRWSTVEVAFRVEEP